MSFSSRLFKTACFFIFASAQQAFAYHYSCEGISGYFGNSSGGLTAYSDVTIVGFELRDQTMVLNNGRTVPVQIFHEPGSAVFGASKESVFAIGHYFGEIQFTWVSGVDTIVGKCVDLEAKRSSEKSAADGDAEAQVQQGFRALREDRSARGKQEAKKWFRRAAEQGHARAKVELAKLTSDLEEKKLLLLGASHQGNIEGIYHLTSIFSREKDYANAFYWYRIGATKHATTDTDRNAQMFVRHNLGNSYRNGFGVKKDAMRAFMWISLSGVAPETVKEISETMSADQIEMAEGMAQVCRDSMFENCFFSD